MSDIKVEIVPPKQVERVVRITMTTKHARVLKKILGRCCGGEGSARKLSEEIYNELEKSDLGKIKNEPDLRTLELGCWNLDDI